jgi:hypothetical protein
MVLESERAAKLKDGQPRLRLDVPSASLARAPHAQSDVFLKQEICLLMRLAMENVSVLRQVSP